MHMRRLTLIVVIVTKDLTNGLETMLEQLGNRQIAECKRNYLGSSAKVIGLDFWIARVSIFIHNNIQNNNNMLF